MTRAKPKKKRRWLRRLITWVLVLALAAGAFVLFVLPSWQAEATTTYTLYTASRGTISNALSFSGSVSVINHETLTPGRRVRYASSTWRRATTFPRAIS